MPALTLDRRTALVLIDLQKGITSLPTIEPSDAIVANSARLAAAFRSRGLPVVLVRTAHSADGRDRLAPRTDAPAISIKRDADFSDLSPELGLGGNDIVITKRQWDAFFGTELDLQLRRREVTGIVLAGIATSMGVESTARQAFSLGYQIAFAMDATTDLIQTAHENSLRTIFPHIGQIAMTDAIIASLAVGG